MSDPFDICSRITRNSASNLWYVSRGLRSGKYRFFIASYASMRIIDDFVDDQFLLMSAAVRAKKRDETLARLESWRASAVSAANNIKKNHPWHPEVFSALQMTLGKSDLGAGPWLRLGAAMGDDIREKKLLNWQDFLDYCEGATVAPAEVFLYVLLAHETADGNLRFDADLNLIDLARDMAVFCYLVHIMRDLLADGKQGGQVITLPQDMLADFSLTRDTLRDPALRDNVVALQARLILKTAELIENLDCRLAQIKPLLARRESVILVALLRIYRRLFERIEKNPAASLHLSPAELKAERESLARAIFHPPFEADFHG